jgi:virginiamycin A acetyltransferase
MKSLKELVRKCGQKTLKKFYPQLKYLDDINLNWGLLKSSISETKIEESVKLYKPYHLHKSYIGSFSYISQNANISMTSIGKFCSIGPNFLSGWGIHPTSGLSTSPMFYSTLKQNGTTLSSNDKIEERKIINIGNDVFIGANVIVLDGVTIGDGAIIGAGAIVSKNIPPYGIAVGSPIQIIRFRFTDNQINKLLKIKWWNFNEEQLKDIERLFFEVDKFISKYEDI